MAGAIRALGTMVTGGNGLGVFKNMFYWINSFFANHSAYTRIASYYGDKEFEGSPPVQVGGLGFGPTGSATAVGDAAWAVYRNTGGTDTFDLFIGFSNTVDVKTHPSGAYVLGAGGGSGGSTGLGMMWAWHSSSASWNGTTNNNGLDYFTTPWKSDAILMPCSNEKANPAAGAFGVSTTGSRNGACLISAAGPNTQTFLLCSADNDSFVIVWDAVNRQYTRGIIMERYVPFSSDFDLPYVMIGSDWVADFVPYKQYYNMNTAIGVGITARKNLPGRTALSSSYSPTTEYPSFLSRGYGNIGNQNFGSGFTSGSTPTTISEFPLHLAINSPVKKYAGHTTLFRLVSHNVGSDVKFANGERYSFASQIPGPPPTVPTWASCSIGWTTTAVTHPSSSTASSINIFHTSSFAGIAYMPVTCSNMFEDVTVPGSWDYFVRGRSGANYEANLNTAPPGTTDVVILFPNYADLH